MLTILDSLLDLRFACSNNLIKLEAALVQTAQYVPTILTNQSELNVPPNPICIKGELFFETLLELSENDQEEIRKM